MSDAEPAEGRKPEPRADSLEGRVLAELRRGARVGSPWRTASDVATELGVDRKHVDPALRRLSMDRLVERSVVMAHDHLVVTWHPVEPHGQGRP